ncbi:hypothetical protein Tco_0566576 [Tanacetum coccineum]
MLTLTFDTTLSKNRMYLSFDQLQGIQGVLEIDLIDLDAQVEARKEEEFWNEKIGCGLIKESGATCPDGICVLKNRSWDTMKPTHGEVDESLLEGSSLRDMGVPVSDYSDRDAPSGGVTDCDDLSSAKAVLMANLSSCDLEVLSEVPYFDSYPNDMINQDVQEMQYSEQTHIDDFQDNEIHSDSNTIPYSQYLQESQDAVIKDTNSSAPNDLLVLSLVEQMTDHVAHLDKENQTNKMVNESLTAELERYKERVAIFE